MRHAYSPHISATKRQKAPTGVASDVGHIRPPLGPLNAARERFLPPTAAARLAPPHTLRACALRLCSVAAGQHASRRAPPCFAGLTPPRNGEARNVACNVAASVRLLRNSGWTPDPKSRGARAATLSCRRGYAPHYSTAAGAAAAARAAARKWLPPRLRTHAGACALWRTAGAPAPASHLGVRRLPPRFLRGIANGLRGGSPPLALGIAARSACHPCRCNRRGAVRILPFHFSHEVIA